MMRSNGCYFARSRLNGVGTANMGITFSFSSSSARRCCGGMLPSMGCTFYSFSKGRRRLGTRLRVVVSNKTRLTATSEKTRNYILCSKRAFCERPTIPVRGMISAVKTNSSLVASFLINCASHVGGNRRGSRTVGGTLTSTTGFTSRVYKLRNTFNCKERCRWVIKLAKKLR